MLHIMHRVLFTALISAGLAAGPSFAEVYSVGGKEIVVERMASRLDSPWGIAFLPNCAFLVTERGGNLIHVDDRGKKQTINGVPEVVARGQGGLLDIETAKDFETSREVFLTYSVKQGRGLGTALAVARLSVDGFALEEVRQIFQMQPEHRSSRHFGSRVVEAPDGSLFVTLGDRGDRGSAQELSSHNGSIVRLLRNGTVPEDNPFIDVIGVLPEIWSFGHRNPQGASFDSQGRLWISEHGARGGDEVNLIERGKNYGWPVISYGVHYTGHKIGEGTAKEGLEQPQFYWDPSIAPSGMIVYSGKLWPEWKDQLFVGSLKFDYIARLAWDGELREAEQIDFPETKRVRDVQEAPDGSIWFISEDRRAVYRITPAVSDSAETSCTR